MILKGNRADVINEIKQVLPDYDGGRYQVRYNTDKQVIEYNAEGEPITENSTSPSGWRADVFELGQEVITPAEIDEQGNEIAPAELGDHQFQVDYPVFHFEAIEWRKTAKLTRRKFMLGIKFYAWGEGTLEDAINALRASLPEPHKTVIGVSLDSSNFFERNDPELIQMATSIGMNAQQIDDFFVWAENEEWRNG